MKYNISYQNRIYEINGDLMEGDYKQINGVRKGFPKGEPEQNQPLIISEKNKIKISETCSGVL